MKRGVTTMKRTMKRRRATLAGHPLGDCPSSPIKGPPLLHIHTHIGSSSLPQSFCPKIHLGLAKLCRIVSSSFTHLEKCVLECPADPFFRCPTGPRAWRSRRWAIRVSEYGGAAGCGAVYTILWSSSEPLRRLRTSSSTLHRKHFCGNVIPATGLRGLVNHCYHLVVFSWLVYVFMHRKFFCFLCYKPIITHIHHTLKVKHILSTRTIIHKYMWFHISPIYLHLVVSSTSWHGRQDIMYR
jgi:hypothetical protein